MNTNINKLKRIDKKRKYHCGSKHNLQSKIEEFDKKRNERQAEESKEQLERFVNVIVNEIERRKSENTVQTKSVNETVNSKTTNDENKTVNKENKIEESETDTIIKHEEHNSIETNNNKEIISEETEIISDKQNEISEFKIKDTVSEKSIELTEEKEEPKSNEKDIVENKKSKRRIKRIKDSTKSTILDTVIAIFCIIVAICAVIGIMNYTNKRAEENYYTSNLGVAKEFKYWPAIVISESMEPAIMTSAVIICEKWDFDDLHIGDVIAFWYDGEMITHRVHEVTTNLAGFRVLKTKGDNNPYPDRFEVDEEMVEGKVIKVFNGVAPLIKKVSGSTNRLDTQKLTVALIWLVAIAGASVYLISWIIKVLKACKSIHKENKFDEQMEELRDALNEASLSSDEIRNNYFSKNIFARIRLSKATNEIIGHLRDYTEGGIIEDMSGSAEINKQINKERKDIKKKNK